MARIFEAYTFVCVNVRTLELLTGSTKVSTEEILVFPFACEICQRSIFSKFDAFACEFYGTICDM